MQHLVRLHAGSQARCLKNARIGLADAELLGTDAGCEIRADANAVHIGIAVGQGHQREPARQESQRVQRVAIQRDPVAFAVEDVEGCTSQSRVVAAAAQCQGDGLEPQSA